MQSFKLLTLGIWAVSLVSLRKEKTINASQITPALMLLQPDVSSVTAIIILFMFLNTSV